MANVLQWKVLDFVSNFLLVVVAVVVVVVAMWNAFGVAEKGREAVEEGGEGGGAAYEVDDDRDDGPLTLVSCATESLCRCVCLVSLPTTVY